MTEHMTQSPVTNHQPPSPGPIIVLNGAPRSGKSSIVAAIQESFDGVWMNLGVDVHIQATPPGIRPGIGLRPNEPAHAAAPLVPALYRALYESIAAHSRAGFGVVADVGHHGDPAVLAACARIVAGLPAWLIGVRCPIEVIMQRRHVPQAGREQSYLRGTPEDPVPAPVAAWQRDVHVPGIYDLEVDTSLMTPEECADAIRSRMTSGDPPLAFATLAAG